MGLGLADNPEITNPELGRRVNELPNTVFKWRKDLTSYSSHLDDHLRTGRPAIFPRRTSRPKPSLELPYSLQLPLIGLSLPELRDYLIQPEVVEHISIGKLWSVLGEDAVRPWFHRNWLFPRDRPFLGKAGPILNLHQGTFQDCALRAQGYVQRLD
jgi:hypothetical protein